MLYNQQSRSPMLSPRIMLLLGLATCFLLVVVMRPNTSTAQHRSCMHLDAADTIYYTEPCPRDPEACPFREMRDREEFRYNRQSLDGQLKKEHPEREIPDCESCGRTGLVEKTLNLELPEVNENEVIYYKGNSTGHGETAYLHPGSKQEILYEHQNNGYCRICKSEFGYYTPKLNEDGSVIACPKHPNHWTLRLDPTEHFELLTALETKLNTLPMETTKFKVFEEMVSWDYYTRGDGKITLELCVPHEKTEDNTIQNDYHYFVFGESFHPQSICADTERMYDGVKHFIGILINKGAEVQRRYTLESDSLPVDDHDDSSDE